MARTRRPAKPARPAAKKSDAKRADAKRADANPSRSAAKSSGRPARRATASAKPAKPSGKPAKPSGKPAKPATPSATASKPGARASSKPSSSAASSAGLLAIEAQLRDHAMAKPQATEHFPWGERAIKVNGKVFLFMRADAQQLSLSTKLPQSGQVALLLPFATPTGYGLGKAGWVSAAFSASQPPPVDMLCSWIDESYRAVAPAKLAALARTGD
jgi:predicted DNA-binding protein (MmcQ/YjbR family)